MERSKELIQAGYYLSKYGLNDPPKRLETNKWNEAYRLFYDKLNGGRGVLEFENSLKNLRDSFDGYFSETNRKGCKGVDGKPVKLSEVLQNIFNLYNNKSENFIWSKIEPYLDVNHKIKTIIFNDLIAEDNAGSDLENTKTEGGIKVRIMKSIERSPRLRQEAIEIHGFKCQVCSFDFEITYGEWGKEFAEVHHIKPLAELKGEKYKTNPKTDLAVLCANCHRMIHRKHGITLSINELKEKIKTYK